MANKYRGEVEFQDSEGTTYVLRLGVNEYLDVEKEAEQLAGRRWQRFMFHQALIHGAESQRNLTLEDAGELMNDIGYVRCDQLLSETRFGKNSAEVAKEVQRQIDEAKQKEKASAPADPPSAASNN